MFGLLGGRDDSHDERVRKQAERLDRLGYEDIHADHVSDYPDTGTRNGRRPDVTADGPFGGEAIIEIDSSAGTSSREREQLEDLEASLEPNEELFHVDEGDDLLGGW